MAEQARSGLLRPHAVVPDIVLLDPVVRRVVEVGGLVGAVPARSPDHLSPQQDATR